MKEKLRKLYKAKRLQIPDELIASYDERILRQLQELPIGNSSAVHVYLPIRKWKEFSTFPYIDWLRSQRSDLSIVISKVELHTGNLEHYLFDQDVTVSVNLWGIPEPVDSGTLKKVDPLSIDYVIVPLLVCDAWGNRIGYGKGFYDRFLLQCRVDVHKIGVSYFPAVQQLIKADPWDIPLDMLICPEGTVEFY